MLHTIYFSSESKYGPKVDGWFRFVMVLLLFILEVFMYWASVQRAESRRIYQKYKDRS